VRDSKQHDNDTKADADRQQNCHGSDSVWKV